MSDPSQEGRQQPLGPGATLRPRRNTALLSLPWVIWRAEEVRTPLCF